LKALGKLASVMYVGVDVYRAVKKNTRRWCWE